MSTDNLSSVSIQTSEEPIASVPAWFGEVALLAHTLTRLGLLAEISARVRFARPAIRARGSRSRPLADRARSLRGGLSP